MLETRRLGKSDLKITKVGVGTAPIGSTPEWRVWWGPQDEKSAIEAIQTALDEGVNWIDTAPFYGWGKAEEIVGKAIKGRRDDVYVFTKCGTLPDGKGGSIENHKPGTIQREIEKDILPFSLSHQIGVLGWGSLAEGFLADNFSLTSLDPKDFRRNHWYGQPENQDKLET